MPHPNVVDAPRQPRAPLSGGSWGRVPDRIADWARAAAGPALIVIGPAIILRGFWMWGRLTIQHVDLMPFWLPRWCYLGSSVSSWHVPTWLPYQFGGVPFVSDPQSGWLYAPVMSLFSVLSCTRALDVMIVLNPILAGLGMYVFFRKEGVGLPAATVGGLTLALSMSTSAVVLSMPFSGTLAWTALSLAGAAGYLHARALLPALAWLALAEFSLSQVAAAQMTDGLLIAAVALGAYVVVRSILHVRTGARSARSAALMVAGLVAAFPVLAAAIFLPRLSLIPRTSIGNGYGQLGRLASQLMGFPVPPAVADHGLNPWWGTAFARGPNGYVGVLAILLAPVALTSRRWRGPALGFLVAGLIGWVLNLNWLIQTRPIRRFALQHWLGELWLRSPDRFRYLLILAFAGLAGYGVQAWLDLAPLRTWKAAIVRSMKWLPALALFVIAPLALGSPIGRYVPVLAGSAVAVPLLLALARGARWAGPALPVLVALELTTSGVVASAGATGPARSSAVAIEGTNRFARAFGAMREPVIQPSSYLTLGPIGQALVRARGDSGRYLAFDPKIARLLTGFLARQQRRTWAAYENGRSILFGIDEIQGYSPVQVDRYWRLVRRVAEAPLNYNAAGFQVYRPEVLRLFGVEWVIARKTQPPLADWDPVATEGLYVLYRLSDAQPRASVVFDWDRVPAGAGLDVVLRPDFDPAKTAIVEAAPSVRGQLLSPPPSATGSADYREVSPEHVLVRVTSTAPGLLVIRNAFDRNWHAVIDGRPAPLLPTDYLMQGVAVPSGSHTVELVYRDRAVGYGILLSGAAWAILLGVMAWAAARSRMRRRASPVLEPSPERPAESIPTSQPGLP